MRVLLSLTHVGVSSRSRTLKGLKEEVLFISSPISGLEWIGCYVRSYARSMT